MDPVIDQRSWTFLTNHAHVLLAISATPDLRVKDIAARVNITERTAAQIVTDLENGGVIEREKRGRRNHYVVRPHHPLRHPLEEHHEVADLIAAISHHGDKHADNLE
ncbi:MAG: putative transcriptional regulator [Candidatus Aldehydirespiratoraceae bacterium]|jgi:predicted transcriptional regulator